MYKRIHHPSTPCGSPTLEMSARRPARGRDGRQGLCTSVTASRMTDAYGASTPVGVHRSPLFTVSGVASVSLKCVTIRSFIHLGLWFHPYGTAVPCLRDCSSMPTGLQFHAYGTVVPSLRDCSAIPMGLQSLPQETKVARLCGTPAGGAFFLVVKLKCVTPGLSILAGIP